MALATLTLAASDFTVLYKIFDKLSASLNLFSKNNGSSLLVGILFLYHCFSFFYSMNDKLKSSVIKTNIGLY
ncbi:hypothetical protein LDG_6252 [Legionella drancourtii LLAP12]|uniref:Uncharacterized protein n=1 Tax=Legionella drancourtii LLAP12 TaxID=658187 RepID=G9ELZ1_9GAMM|nr:hypothetical protein LDG_6252 [Legionella drancourtii LLAP12]